ncbi:MAG: beta-mannosidase [Puniceicoccaceae bacterium 5H]|nr:MAG: beta-mannosidase [Puniceicoccaceae bacterium 5H]
MELRFPLRGFSWRHAALTFSLLAGSLHLPALTPAQPLAPEAGRTLANNAPTLSWAPIKADQLEVWIDGHRAEVLPGNVNQYVPFPLGFGEHQWRVVAIRGEERVEGPQGYFTVEDAPLEPLPDHAVLLRDGWQVRSSALIKEGGQAISSPDFAVEGWHETTLPTTVLGALVRNGVYPNPYFGLNNMRIPDASDAYNQHYGLLEYSHIEGKNPWAAPYWFRTQVAVPQDYAGQQIWLTFNELNYRADVWINGQQIGKAKEVAGMERQFRFDVTPYVQPGQPAYIAVAVHPLDVPAEPALEPEGPLGHPGTNMGPDGKISLNYTKWDAIGWDWQPPVRDRDIGLTEDVYLSATPEVEIRDLYAAADLELQPTQADLYLALDLVNHAAETRAGTLQLEIADDDGETITLEQPYKLEPEQTQHLVWQGDDEAALHLAHPKLWWPAEYGPQHLYHVQAQLDNGDREQTHFGIRKIETEMGETSRLFKVNGREIYARGGNWVIDMMLTWNAERYEQEILLAKQAGLNFLRVWGPTGAPPQAFYDAADRHGMLIQQDFLNDYWGTFRNDPDLRPPEDLFRAASIDIVKKYRNHPSLFIWCGGNEGVNPREELLTQTILPQFDPHGGRFYLPASNNDGLTGGGPYDNLDPQAYFGHKKLTGFNSEVGPSGVPEFESMVKFLQLPPTEWAEGRYPLDTAWALHDAVDRTEDTRKFSHYDDILRRSYGQLEATGVEGVRAYAQKAQLVNYDVYRAAIEALNKQLWDGVTGFSLWKYNSSWPSLVWQLTDWYLQPNAGLYAVRKAAEPVHIQLNRDDLTLTVLNRTDAALQDVHLEAEVLKADASSAGSLKRTVSVAPESKLQTEPLALGEGFRFVALKLVDSDGQILSRNVYWVHPDSDYTVLNQLPPAELDLSWQPTGDGTFAVTVRNQGQNVALLTRLKLIDAATQLEVLPTYWSDNYLHLLPGETVTVTARVAPADLPAKPALAVQAYNAESRTMAADQPAADASSTAVSSASLASSSTQ